MFPLAAPVAAGLKRANIVVDVIVDPVGTKVITEVKPCKYWVEISKPDGAVITKLPVTEVALTVYLNEVLLLFKYTFPKLGREVTLVVITPACATCARIRSKKKYFIFM
jgi:hypothetical protein